MTLRVLIVEDDLELAMVIEEAAISAGYEVCAHVQTAAGSTAAAPRTDIALIDINLGEEIGTDIGETLANDWGVTVLFMTGSPEIVADGFPSAVGVLAKPVDAASVIEALDYAAARRSGETPFPPQSLIGFA